MIVHTPIEEFEEGIEADGAGTKLEIRGVVPEPPPCWAIKLKYPSQFPMKLKPLTTMASHHA